MMKFYKTGASSVRLAAAITALSAAFVSIAQTPPRTLSVNGDRVNLRAAPNSEAEVVGQVSRNDTLVLQGEITDAWVKVSPPESINLWIFASLVKDGKITASAAQVRAGAGLNYHTVGRLQRGDAVTIRGQVGDWLKIAPFPEASVWVTNSYVSLNAPSKAAPIPAPIPAPAPEPVAAPAPALAAPAQTPAPATQTPVPAPAHVAQVAPPKTAPPPQAPVTQAQKPVAKPPAPPPPPSANQAQSSQSRRTLLGNRSDVAVVGPASVPASKLRSDVAQAAKGSYAGVLALSPAGSHPAGFRLVAFDGDSPRTLCYVLGNSRQLDSLRGGRFTIEGAVYWYNGTSLPTVFAQDIMRHKK